MLSFNDITLSLYGKAGCTEELEDRKEQVAQFEGHSGMYQQETVLASLTDYYLSYTHPNNGHNVQERKTLN